MKFSSINLPKSQIFPCSVKDLKDNFLNNDLLSLRFQNSNMATIRYRKIKFQGQVLLNLIVPRTRSNIYLKVFPIKLVYYDNNAKNAFISQILPKVSKWLNQQMSMNQLQITSTEELFVSYSGGEYIISTKSFLD